MTKQEREQAVLVVKEMREHTFKLADALIKSHDAEAHGQLLQLQYKVGLVEKLMKLK